MKRIDGADVRKGDTIRREDWIAVTGHPGYEVSNLGNVRSWKTYGSPAPRLLAKSEHGGYHVVSLSRCVRRVHRLVLEAFVGKRPAGLLTRHLDGNATNNCLDNLRYGTPSENMRDRRTHGTDANVNKTHCANGHEFTESNTLIRKRPMTYSGPKTYRACRICRNAVKRENWRRKQLALAAIDAANGDA